MTRSHRLSWAAAALLSLGLAAAPAAAQKADKDRSSLEAARKQAAAQYETDSAACKPMKDNARDVCMAEAKAKRRVAIAEANASFENDERARRKATEERADAMYDVAREKCDDLKGNEKDVCMKQARADRDKARAGAQARAETSKAAREVKQTGREGDYRVAREKCDAMSGADKDACLAQAKARFGK